MTEKDKLLERLRILDIECDARVAQMKAARAEVLEIAEKLDQLERNPITLAPIGGTRT